MAKRALQLTPGPVNMTKFPLEVHFAAETRMLVWVGSDARASLQTLTSTGARTDSALALSIEESMWCVRASTRLGQTGGVVAWPACRWSGLA